jgi:hypothetical protein
MRRLGVVRIDNAEAQHQERLSCSGKNPTQDPLGGIGLDGGTHG